jgi:phosphatidylserine/phosphatidylglycerophosphate/cardiolipin synthase-like enzyme
MPGLTAMIGSCEGGKNRPAARGDTTFQDGADRRRAATAGSTNLDGRSFLSNLELNAAVLGAELGKQVQAMFAKDLAASDTITLAEWERRAPPAHL